MGSGKSKESQPKEQNKTPNSIQTKQKSENKVVKQADNIKNDTKTNGHITETTKTKEESSENQKESQGNINTLNVNDGNLDLDNAWRTNTNTDIQTTNNNNNNNNKVKHDSDLEEELRFNEFNKRKSMEIEQLSRAKQEHYPETYAEKNLRQQYTTEFLRQKTMYKNDDDWNDIDEGSEQSFDVTKFQKVNKGTSQPKKDIFGNEVTDYTYQDSYDYSYGQSNRTPRKSLPKYDISEEELMADIEKEMIF